MPQMPARLWRLASPHWRRRPFGRSPAFGGRRSGLPEAGIMPAGVVAETRAPSGARAARPRCSARRTSGGRRSAAPAISENRVDVVDRPLGRALADRDADDAVEPLQRTWPRLEAQRGAHV